MHGIIANLIASAGRSILNDVTESARNGKANEAQSATSFDKVLSAQSVKEASSLQEIFEQNPKISKAELMQVSQSLKTEILQSQAGQFGERAPLSHGEWTITQQTDPAGNKFLRITDLDQKSMQISPESPTFKKVNLLYQIQEHLNTPSEAFTSL